MRCCSMTQWEDQTISGTERKRRGQSRLILGQSPVFLMTINPCTMRRLRHGNQRQRFCIATQRNGVGRQIHGECRSCSLLLAPLNQRLARLPRVSSMWSMGPAIVYCWLCYRRPGHGRRPIRNPSLHKLLRHAIMKNAGSLLA